ncbi:MAG: WD40 repeat domain-containing protein, partial [Gemmataceae bacterium]
MTRLTLFRTYLSAVFVTCWLLTGAPLASAQELKATLKGHAREVTSLVFSPDGRTLASAGGNLALSAGAGEDNTIKIWDVLTGQLKATLVGHTGYVLSVCLSPDGSTLASASSDKTVKVWEVSTGKLKSTLEGHTDCVHSVSYSPDGKTLASAGGFRDKTIKLWDVLTGQLSATLQGHTRTVSCVRFSPDGRTLASASSDKTVKIWDV